MATKFISVLFGVAFLGGCSGPPPQYAPPTNSEVEGAYKAGVETKIAELRAIERPSTTGGDGKIDSIGEMAAVVNKTVEFARDIGTLDSLRSTIRGLVKIKVHSCIWGKIDLRDVNEFNRPPKPDQVDYGYRCKIESFHRASDIPGAIIAYDVTAYLWKARESFYFAEIDHGPARISKAEDALAEGLNTAGERNGVGDDPSQSSAH